MTGRKSGAGNLWLTMKMKESFPLVTNEMDDVIKPEIVLAETDEWDDLLQYVQETSNGRSRMMMLKQGVLLKVA